VLEQAGTGLFGEAVDGSRLDGVTETPDDLLEPDDEQTEDASELDDDEDEDPGLSAEESLGLLPPD
jgi:hypothetical protein